MKNQNYFLTKYLILMKNFITVLFLSMFMFSINAQDSLSCCKGPSPLDFSITAGFSDFGEGADVGNFDAGIMVNGLAPFPIQAGFIFDIDDNNVLDYGLKFGIGYEASEQYTFFGNVVYLNFPGDDDWSYGIDVYRALSENFSLSVGVETSRGVRAGIAYTF